VEELLVWQASRVNVSQSRRCEEKEWHYLSKYASLYHLRLMAILVHAVVSRRVITSVATSKMPYSIDDRAQHIDAPGLVVMAVMLM
jgi:hypothetical protein